MSSIVCSVGNDIRKAISDGYPIQYVIASDLRQGNLVSPTCAIALIKSTLRILGTGSRTFQVYTRHVSCSIYCWRHFWFKYACRWHTAILRRSSDTGTFFDFPHIVDPTSRPRRRNSRFVPLPFVWRSAAVTIGSSLCVSVIPFARLSDFRNAPWLGPKGFYVAT